MIRRRIVIVLFCLMLTGCWSNEEIDRTAIVHGVGVDKIDDQLVMSVEIVKPTGQGGESLNESDNSGNQLVLDIKADTFLQGARELIKYTKRRLNFSQVQAWIIGERLAEEEFVKSLDIIRRDQMVRLNSLVFITKNNPTDILNTSTLYEDLVATELSSSIEQSSFTAEFTPITFREFFKFIEGPVHNAYVPIISLKEVNNKLITEVEGTAVIKQGKLVGELNRRETAGLNILLNQINGGNIRINLPQNEKVSLEITKLKTKVEPLFRDGQLNVTVNTKVEGILADNMTDELLTEDFVRRLENKLKNHTEKTVETTLEKLQDDLKADIVQFGLKTYRKYPKDWHEVRSKWDDVFADATVNIDVDLLINHKGLINESVSRKNKIQANPFNFKRSKENE